LDYRLVGLSYLDLVDRFQEVVFVLEPLAIALATLVASCEVPLGYACPYFVVSGQYWKLVAD
jgi:hypothetical protein